MSSECTAMDFAAVAAENDDCATGPRREADESGRHTRGLAEGRVGHQEFRLVILESPFAGDVAANQEYARAALRDCLSRGEAPFASHLLYTQPGVLDDADPSERQLGIAAGLAWGDAACATVVYIDRGLSEGMREGIARAELAGRPVEFRSLGGRWV